MPEVSIVVPTHNREMLLPETLNSVLAQTFQDWECVIVDDHSTDNSAAVANSFAEIDSRFRVVHLPDGKRYLNAGRNYGLECAKGKFINYLDSDDLFLPQKLERQLQEFQRQPSWDVVACRYAIFREDPAVDAQQIPFAPQEYWIETLLRGNALVWQQGCVLWRKDVLSSLGPWNESLTVWDDTELEMRALVAKLNITRLDEILMFLRRAGQDRMGSREESERYSTAYQAFTTTWGHLVQAGQVTELRRLLASQNVYASAWRAARAGRLTAGLKEWFHYGRYLELHNGRILAGAVVLTLQTAVRRYPALRLLHPIERRVRQRFFRFRNQLPDPLPDLDSIPTYSPVSELTTRKP